MLACRLCGSSLVRSLASLHAHLPAWAVLGLGVWGGTQPRRPAPPACWRQGAGQLGSWQRPVALFTTWAFLRQALHRDASPEQSAQRGSSQRRHTPLISVSVSHFVQRVLPGDMITHSRQSVEHGRQVFVCAART